MELQDKKVTPIFIDDVDLGEMSHEEVRMEDRIQPDFTETSKSKAKGLDTNQTLRLHE